jgi:hypothetical protein
MEKIRIAGSVGLFLLTAALGFGSSGWPELIKPHPYWVATLGLCGVILLAFPLIGRILASGGKPNRLAPTPSQINPVITVSPTFAPVFNVGNPGGADAAVTTTPIQRLTNIELRHNVLAFAKALRAFEESNDEHVQEFWNLNPQPRPVAGDTASEQKWKRWVNQTVAMHNNFSAQFSERYLADAKIYYEELLRRTNWVKPHDNFMVDTLLQGHVAGPHPIQRLAVELEFLAKKLPH